MSRKRKETPQQEEKPLPQEENTPLEKPERREENDEELAARLTGGKPMAVKRYPDRRLVVVAWDGRKIEIKDMQVL